MELGSLCASATVLAPFVLMSTLAGLAWRASASRAAPWRSFGPLALAALLCALLALALQWHGGEAKAGAAAALAPFGLAPSLPGAWFAVLVQLLGGVIGAFSARYLQGEPGQARYLAAFAGVLAAVQLLLLADHWGVLIVAWSVVGRLLHRLLCFYPDRPFARLAAHKKRLADSLADALLIIAAALAWHELGSGSLTALRTHVQAHGATPALEAGAACLALAVVLRCALLPVHGWLIQVMEAPTPVSALLHAGVVNLGGFVLLRTAAWIEAAPAARWLLVITGLATAVLAGLVMMTRISIKVRLAWSTVAQMGFMVLECGLGLYTLAMLHLIGHSIYKAHAFLSASGEVQRTRLRMMRAPAAPSPASLVAAPFLAFALLQFCQGLDLVRPWPLWWSGVLALAWAPLLWTPARPDGAAPTARYHVGAGATWVVVLGAASLLAHALPFGVADAPHDDAGWLALAGLGLLYLGLAVLQARPQRVMAWRRRAYAGFYLDEIYTRATLLLWPVSWAPAVTPPRAEHDLRSPLTTTP